MTDDDIEVFAENGYVRIPGAVPREIADRCRAELWEATGCDPADRSTWTAPVIRLGAFATPPFREAANTPVLHDAFDRLAGPGRWLPPGGLGTFPVRFPPPTRTPATTDGTWRPVSPGTPGSSGSAWTPAGGRC